MSERRGFTLVEVVLSMAILAMAVAVVFAMLRLAHRAESKGAGRLEADQRVMVLADRLSWLLAGAYPYKKLDKETRKARVVFTGEADDLSFVTTSVDRFSEDKEDLPGLKHVRLWLGPDGLRADERMFYMEDAEHQEYVIEPNVTELEMEYMDEDPETRQTQWVGGWDPESMEYMPLAVSLRVVLDLEGKEVMVPRIVVRLPAGGPMGAAGTPAKAP